MTERLHLSPKHRVLIEALLREHLPGVEVWAYGSRVNGRSHDGSDLDLVLRGPGLTEIPVGQVADFDEAVLDSTIPFLVQARDWARLPEQFHRELERGYVVLVEKETPRESTLGELLSFSNGKASPERSDNSPHPVYGSNGIIGFSDKTNAPSGTIVIGRVGSYCGSLYFSKNSCWVTDNAIRANAVDGNNSRFLFYLLQTLRLNDRRSGSGQPLLNQTILSSIPVLAPSRPEQRAIAHILGTLDDKIELNRRMNETLEAMARALFKSWFVDFDPVRAKAALRTHAAHLDPGSITPPLRGSRGDKGASPQASRWGETGAPPPPRPWPDIKRQYTSKALQHAQVMRQNQTNAEGLLWYYLRNRQLGGYKFRRQQPIGPYIVDFACLPEKLLIELDGGQHADPNAPGAQRGRFLRQQGYRVLRFWNHEVFADCFGVLERVYDALAGPPPLQPAPDGLASATPPQGGSDWSVDRACAYLDAMDPETAALFPDRFVDSELGEIPAGWEVRTLGDLCHKPQYGYTASAQTGAVGPKFLRITDINKTPWIEWENVPYCLASEQDCQKYRLRRGDVLIARMADPGHGVLVEEDLNGVFASYLIRFRPQKESHGRLLQYWLNSDDYWEMVRSRGAGTTRTSLNAKILSEFLLVIPSDAVAAAFSIVIDSIRDRVVANVAESNTLAAQRDALLPKLVSGTVRVRNAFREMGQGT